MDLKVYSASWCRDCREAKRFLTKHNIPFEEIDIEHTPGAADEVLENVGKRAIRSSSSTASGSSPTAPAAASSTKRCLLCSG